MGVRIQYLIARSEAIEEIVAEGGPAAETARRGLRHLYNERADLLEAEMKDSQP